MKGTETSEPSVNDKIIDVVDVKNSKAKRLAKRKAIFFSLSALCLILLSSSILLFYANYKQKQELKISSEKIKELEEENESLAQRNQSLYRENERLFFENKELIAQKKPLSRYLKAFDNGREHGFKVAYKFMKEFFMREGYPSSFFLPVDEVYKRYFGK